MNWDLTRRQYMADFFVVPAFVLMAMTVALMRSEPSMTWLLWGMGGWFAWTLMEYILHRFIFHIFYRRDHARHHAKPFDWIGVTPFVSFISLGLVWLGCFTITADAGRGGALFIGFCVGYYGYMCIHYLIHHSDHKALDRLRRHHLAHHQGAQKNFGVSLTLWDRIFSTAKVT